MKDENTKGEYETNISNVSDNNVSNILNKSTITPSGVKKQQ